MLKVKNIIICTLLSLSGGVNAQNSDQLLTLFTTAPERQVINNNRYKGEQPKQMVSLLPEPEKETNAVKELVKEEVNATYVISGVSNNTEGSGTAWINGKAYLSGDVMEDGAKVSIRNSIVFITTVDGKTHKAVGGEMLELTYLKTSSE